MAEKIMVGVVALLSLVGGVSLFFAHPVHTVIHDLKKSFTLQRALPRLQRGTFWYYLNKVLYVIMGIILLTVSVWIVADLFRADIRYPSI